jgi:hypothetical protein
VKNGANEGSWAQKNALTMMERITEEEQRRNTAANEKKTLKLSGKLNDYSEQEIREAIEATKQLMQAVDMGDAKYKSYGESIAKAEEHLKKYGLEAQRQYVRETQATEEAKQAFEDAAAGKFAKASMEELDDAIKKIKEYQASIKDPTGDGKETFGKAKEQVNALTDRLNALKGVAEKATGTFASADEVMTRWAEHMNAGKTASEGMAQTLNEKLSTATSSVDNEIKDAVEAIHFYEDAIKKDKEAIADLEEGIERLEKNMKSWNPIHRIASKVGHWDKLLAERKSYLEGDGTYENYGWKNSLKHDEDNLDYFKNRLEELKKQKAEELGLTEQVEEKKRDAQRMTN